MQEIDTQRQLVQSKVKFIAKCLWIYIQIFLVGYLVSYFHIMIYGIENAKIATKPQAMPLIYSLLL